MLLPLRMPLLVGAPRLRLEMNQAVLFLLLHRLLLQRGLLLVSAVLPLLPQQLPALLLMLMLLIVQLLPA